MRWARPSQLDPNQVQSYLYLGQSYLALNDLDNASVNFKKAIQFFPDSFDANIGLTETLYKGGTYGNAYLQAETSKSKASDNTQLALAIYWRALSQEGRQALGDAIEDWKTLLSMPADVMTADMRKTAEDHLKTIVTPTYTPKPSLTPRVSRTPNVSATPGAPHGFAHQYSGALRQRHPHADDTPTPTPRK